ncbi:MAG TPA: SRPBCC family protein [Solirubrobacteraceae bacterium]|nr:SRPBCC family protein [Solirubrobacteraceae bacterium]
MATIHKQRNIGVSPDRAWDALADWGALHERLAAGFATDTQLDGTDRIVSFFNGVQARERFVSSDERTRRLAWSIVEGPYAHHNGVARVLDDGAGGTLFEWTADVLPDETAERTAEMMEAGIEAVKRTLEQADG